MSEQLSDLRALLHTQEMAWLHNHKSKTLEYILELDVGLTMINHHIKEQDWVLAAYWYNKLSMDMLDACFYRAKAERDQARKLFTEIGRFLIAAPHSQSESVQKQ